MTCGTAYIPQLRANGYRMTPQRLAILHVLHHARKHLSPIEVFTIAKKDFPRLTEPTVYRTLEFLAENRLARAAHIGRGRLVYEIAPNDHHHLICRSCGKELEVEHAMLERLYRELESATGFQLTDSHVTFFGFCPKCKKGK